MNRSCFSNKMNFKERECLHDLIKVIAKIFKKNDITWIPTGGSLLAIHRHNKLTIPWDDDYDITIQNKDKYKAINVLKQNLKYHKATIIYKRIWRGGDLYKICWSNKKKKYKDIIHKSYKHNSHHNWPFVDLFVDVKNDYRSLGAFPLSKNDFPLKKKIIDNVEISVPTKGIRNYLTFLKRGFITNLKEQSWSHKYEEHLPCIGKKKKELNDLKNKIDKILLDIDLLKNI